MPKASFVTLGCKVNQYETDRLRRDFEGHGFEVVEPGFAADVCVVNSCSVTTEAERKSRGALRRLQRSSPDALLVLTGCYPEMLRRLGHGLDQNALVVPNRDKMDTIRFVAEARPDLLANACPTSAAHRSSHRTRAVVKVQDGCNLNCTYCSIPFTRPAPTSCPAAEVVDEVGALAAVGCPEVVLAGICIGLYRSDGSEGPVELLGLIERLCAVPNGPRVRLSSIEPVHVSDALLGAMARGGRFCPHLHLPLQSGSSRVLRAMGRPYDADAFLEICRRARTVVPGVGLTTDVMVGFPGETEEDFEDSCRVVREAGFHRAHIFRYSVRPGTPAAEMPGQVRPEVKDARAHRLAAVAEEAHAEQAEAARRDAHEVAVEPASGGADLLTGYTGNYLRVRFAGDQALVGSLVRVRVTGGSGGVLDAVLV
ncbi:MAG: tRNA (N(6)-L-threonylcarbamoyladenosine(37)-C(2))-methylthiotransferase MtaB [Armatimonadetes bacterium]|nr:tRNA (N(6)-L-threonylcarbamoyladenosine(37)-C(2))-methylthiotransferase MtaB [Armatimonadota bacterium]